MTRREPSVARISIATAVLLVLAVVGVRNARAAIVADSASDICGAATDPCNITQEIDIVAGSILDFGTRAVVVAGNGILDVGSGTGRIRAGKFTVQVSGTGIRLNDGALGGLLTVESYRKCSLNAAVRCLADATCAAAGAGTCSAGSGEVNLQGRTLGSAEYPGGFIVRAGGDVRVGQRIQISGNTLYSDGGTVDLDAGGSLFVDAPIEVNSGGEATGGEIVLGAGIDLIVGATVDALGGDYDGGAIELTAGRDILVTAGVSADANTGEGFGGSLEADAGRNIEVVGGTSSANLYMTTEGHTGYDGATAYAGDGGFQFYTAGGSVSFGPYVRLRANGALPDGSGDEISVYADGPIVVQGIVETRTRGTLGAGGLIDFESADSVTFAASSSIDVRGGESGGGEAYVTALGDIVFAGALDVSASSGGIGGYVNLNSDQQLTISGVVTSSGVSGGLAVGQFSFHGCRVDVLGGARVENLSAAGRNTFSVGDRLRILSGATVQAGTGGQNRVQYRDPAVPPQITGSVTPAAILSVNNALPSCPLCGNGTVNLDETCDDGNVAGGDGCSADCQHEGCIAQTPSYPSVPLCSDGNPCTADRCDTVSGICTHVASCDDGFACTVDECVGSVCVHTPMDVICDDNNECTTQSCSQGFGCSITAISGSCDDELWCNGTDVCLGGACALHSGNPCAGGAECLNVCNEEVDSCRAPYGYPCTGDGNLCTDDVCSGVGACLHVANTVQCDDGVFCDGVDFCRDGACAFSVGNPCDAASQCAHTCDEAANRCAADAGDPCADDGNACTDDYCDGLGGCAHAENAAPCDDGDFCTVTDVCAAGQCAATDRVDLPSARITASRRSSVADDRITIKASAPLVDLSASPTSAGLSFTLRDASGSEIYAGHLPAEGIVDSGGSGVTFKFRDSKGIYPTANGVVSATVKRITSKGTARLSLKARGIDFAPFTGIGDVAFSVLLGADPSSGDCVSARALPCTSSINSLRCSY
jgi:cysteine-rich repeat protein